MMPCHRSLVIGFLAYTCFRLVSILFLMCCMYFLVILSWVKQNFETLAATHTASCIPYQQLKSIMHFSFVLVFCHPDWFKARILRIVFMKDMFIWKIERNIDLSKPLILNICMHFVLPVALLNSHKICHISKEQNNRAAHVDVVRSSAFSKAFAYTIPEQVQNPVCSKESLKIFQVET